MITQEEAQQIKESLDGKDKELVYLRTENNELKTNLMDKIVELDNTIKHGDFLRNQKVGTMAELNKIKEQVKELESENNYLRNALHDSELKAATADGYILRITDLEKKETMVTVPFGSIQPSPVPGHYRQESALQRKPWFQR